jgi:hypothetical protein
MGGGGDAPYCLGPCGDTGDAAARTKNPCEPHGKLIVATRNQDPCNIIIYSEKYLCRMEFCNGNLSRLPVPFV